MVMYKMTCGCQVDEDDLIFRYGSRLCKKHSFGRNAGRIELIIKRCVDCGKLMELLPRQHSKILCDACKKEKRNERIKMRYKEKIKAERKNVKEKILFREKLDLSLYRDGLSKYLT